MAASSTVTFWLWNDEFCYLRNTLLCAYKLNASLTQAEEENSKPCCAHVTSSLGHDHKCWSRTSDRRGSWALFSWEMSFDYNREVREYRQQEGRSWDVLAKPKHSKGRNITCLYILRLLVVSQAFLEIKLQIQNKFYFFSRQRDGGRKQVPAHSTPCLKITKITYLYSTTARKTLIFMCTVYVENRTLQRELKHLGRLLQLIQSIDTQMLTQPAQDSPVLNWIWIGPAPHTGCPK